MTGDPEFRYKQCLVLRSDVKMSCGKMCAQAGHASIAAYERCDRATRDRWRNEGQKKVVLKVAGERALHELKALSEAAGISAALIQDAGLTENPPGHHHGARPGACPRGPDGPDHRRALPPLRVQMEPGIMAEETAPGRRLESPWPLERELGIAVVRNRRPRYRRAPPGDTRGLRGGGGLACPRHRRRLPGRGA